MASAEKWTTRELKPGDIIRADTGRYYHMGIYIGNEQVIHFAGPDPQHLTDASVARIRKDSLNVFSMQGKIEVRDYSLRERIKKNSAKKVISLAESHLGEGGYDIIYNNCEHFVNLCVFGVAYSTQIDNMRIEAEQGAKKCT
ncbi:MAG: hypothetical protein CW338_08145 [Clostridiales bacterium]|jgi:NC domain./NlpC/P60 family.|nr:hypothetical protein [Clostridiales bacterium]